LVARRDLVAGGFFDSLRRGGDAYLVSHTSSTDRDEDRA
jgi:hypothetical protein